MFLIMRLADQTAGGTARVSTLTRCLAKGADLFVIFFLSLVLPYPLGVLLGFVYTLIHDGIRKGQSLGKWLFNLKVIHLKDNQPCTLRESVIRNAPLGVATFFGIIPFWGWIILIVLGVPLMALEVYLMMTLEHGGRLGDIMADTKVVDAPRPPKNQ